MRYERTKQPRIASVLFSAILCLALTLTLCGPSWAAMGNIRSFAALDDADVDIVGKGSTIEADGLIDAGFSLSLSGGGAITRITLKNITANKTWDSSASGSQPILAVRGGENNEIINSGGSMGLYAFLIGTQLTLWVNDREGTLAKEGVFEVAVHFVDKSTATSKITVKAVPKTQKPAAILSADYLGPQERQITGLQRMEKDISRDANYNLVTEVRIAAKGHITGFRLKNTAGPAGTWDTAMDNNSRLLIALPADAPAMLNKPNGSVNIPIDGERTYHLVMDNTEDYSARGVRTTLYVYLDDNRVLEKEVTRRRTPPSRPNQPQQSDGSGLKFSSLEFRGRGAYDFVGDSPKPGANLNPDNFIAASIEAKGTLSGIKVTGTWGADKERKSVTWDTLPSSNNAALVVTRADGKPLNRLDGSISEALDGKDNLLLWFDAGTGVGAGATFHVTMLFSDGRIVEGTTKSAK